MEGVKFSKDFCEEIFELSVHVNLTFPIGSARVPILSEVSEKTSTLRFVVESMSINFGSNMTDFIYLPLLYIWSLVFYNDVIIYVNEVKLQQRFLLDRGLFLRFLENRSLPLVHYFGGSYWPFLMVGYYFCELN